MGALSDAIDAIEAGPGTREQKRAQRAAAKIAAWNEAIASRLPYTIVIDGVRSVEITSAVIHATAGGSPCVTAHGVYRRNGEVTAYSWPWKIVNPPTAIPSTQQGSDITRTWTDIEGQTQTRYFKEDLEEVLRQLAALSFR